MSNNTFFKPTPLYKEFMILDLIEKNKDITQREMSNILGVAVSMINAYIDVCESKGLVNRKRYSTKTVEYFITNKGSERRKLLNIWYLKSSQEIYLSAKDNISVFLNQITEKGFRKILLYGAGEVAEIVLDVIQNDNDINLEVLAVIDDDLSKKGTMIINKQIITPDNIIRFEHDGILISSYTHHKIIFDKLHNSDYDKKKIIQFFN